MPANLYEALWIFVVYAFVGWCAEVAFAALKEGTFINRGFLNGPYCPIYGVGVLIVVAVLTPLKGNLLIMFLGSFLLTSILEYMTGFVLEKAFGNKWWDYSDMPFNIHGYVCMMFSVLWGLGCMFIMDSIHPRIYKLILWIPKRIGLFLLVVLLSAFLVDAIVTVNTILKFNKKMRMLEEIATGMHKISDEIGEDIYEAVTEIAEKAEDVQDYLKDKREDVHEDVQEARARLEELRAEYRKTLEEKTFGVKRLMHAFPNLRSKKHDKMIQEYKKFLKIEKKKKK